jgi:hypothetical protein
MLYLWIMLGNALGGAALLILWLRRNHLATFPQADYALLVTIFVLVIGEKI